MSPSLSLPNIATHLPFTYTGADFYALCSDAMLKAVTRQASAVDAKIAKHNSQLQPGDLPMTPAYFFDHHATKEDIAVMVTEADFLAANRELIPSVSAKELEHYKKVREQFENVEEKKDDSVERKPTSMTNGKAAASVNGVSNGSGVPEWQLAERPKTNGKTRYKGKGKGKATAEDMGDDSEVEGYVKRSNSSGGGGGLFQEGRIEDEEDLY